MRPDPQRPIWTLRFNAPATVQCYGSLPVLTQMAGFQVDWDTTLEMQAAAWKIRRG